MTGSGGHLTPTPSDTAANATPLEITEGRSHTGSRPLKTTPLNTSQFDGQHPARGDTLRLCRELCFSLVRKKRADCVWERVRGLDGGRKSAGSVAVGNERRMSGKEMSSATIGHIGMFLLDWLRTC